MSFLNFAQVSSLLLLLLLLNQSEAFSVGFTVNTKRAHRATIATSLRETPSDFDGDKGVNDDTKGGQELARQFYKFQKQQQGQQQPRAVIDEEDGSVVSYTARSSPQQSTDDPSSSVEPIKFTGQGSPLFGNSNSNTNNNNTPPNALDREREREFNLAGNFEQTLPLQVAVLVASFAFVIYVGVTGGITDGSDRANYYYDETDYEAMQQIQNEQNNGFDSNTINSEPQAPSGISSSNKDTVWL